MSDVNVHDLRKSFGSVEVLRGVGLHIPAGSLTAVLGPSGCGKTTLLRLVAGFERPDAGTVEVGGQTVAGKGTFVAPERRKVGYVPQEGALFPHLDVAANLTFGLPGGSRRNASRVSELLELVGLGADLATRWPHELSGGQQQRVALARSLAPGPDVVLLDEPFSSLDAGLRESTRQAVAEALLAAGSTALLVTHDQDEALSMADQVAVMGEGCIRQAAAPHELYRAPHSVDVARFVGEANLLAGSAHGDRVGTSLGELALDEPAQGAVTVLVRPEQIELVSSDTHQEEPHGVVIRVAYFGHDTLVTVALGDEAETELVVRQTVHNLGLGDKVAVRVAGLVRGFKPNPDCCGPSSSD